MYYEWTDSRDVDRQTGIYRPHDRSFPTSVSRGYETETGLITSKPSTHQRKYRTAQASSWRSSCVCDDCRARRAGRDRRPAAEGGVQRRALGPQSYTEDGVRRRALGPQSHTENGVQRRAFYKNCTWPYLQVKHHSDGASSGASCFYKRLCHAASSIIFFG